MQNISTAKNTIRYYANLESKWGYRLLLKGNRHFGYYPKDKKNISFEEAQCLMQEKLLKALTIKQGSFVLDAGCGEGNTAIYLAKHAQLNIHGIDLLEESIKIAKEKAKRENVKNVSFRVGDYSGINLGENAYDAIYTMETLVHIKDYKKTLKKFHEALKNKGKLVLFEYTVADPKSLSQKQKTLWERVFDVTAMIGLSSFTHGSFPNIVKEAGFKKVTENEITAHVLPMLKRFYKLAKIPYFFIKLLQQERNFPNSFFSVEAYKDIIEHKTWKYVVVTAVKN